MRKFLLLLLAMTVMLSFCACSDTENSVSVSPDVTVIYEETSVPEETTVPTESKVPEETTEPEPEPELVPRWEVVELVDEFGDRTGTYAMEIVVTGTFSNTAVTDEELTVVIAYNLEDKDYMFSLLEYSEHQATFSSDSEITLKYKLETDPSSTTVVVGGTGTGTQETELIEIEHTGILTTTGFFGTQMDWDLSTGGNLRCIITNGSSKYCFDVPCNGFEEAKEEYKELSQES